MCRSMIVLMCSTLFCLGCSSLRDQGREVVDYAKVQGTALAQEMGQQLLDKAKNELLPQVLEKAKEGTETALKAKLKDQIAQDPDIDADTKGSLLKYADEAAGFAGLLGVLVAFLKAKAAAKLKKTLGTVLKAEASLPEESQKLIRSTMKDLGGDHPTVKETVAAAKQP